MNPWTRLTDGSGTEFERLLLDSARGDAVPPASRELVAARLGVDLARVGTAVAPLSAAASGAAGVGKAGLQPASAGALAKGTLIAVIGGLSAVSAMAEVEAVSAARRPEMETAAVTAPTAAEAVTHSRARSVESTAVEPTTTLVEPTKPSKVSAKRARRAVTPPRASSPTAVEEKGDALDDPLLLEVQQLDRARAALGAGRTLDALRALDSYGEEFPRGALQLEAAVLRVRALERAGRFAHAAREARRVLALPGSERYRSELADAAGSEDTPMDKARPRPTLKEAR